jgi:hypothetical protein
LGLDQQLSRPHLLRQPHSSFATVLTGWRLHGL